MGLYERAVDTEKMVIDVNCLFYGLERIVLVEKGRDGLAELDNVVVVVGVSVVQNVLYAPKHGVKTP